MTMHDAPAADAAINTSADVAHSSRILPTLSAALLGLVLIGGVGFAHIEVVHNAAHDYRHSLGFPCH